MLRQWSVDNFKSVNGRIDLQFAPITIFAGANSSGKSTVLHSILLAKQTIRYAPISRPLALNGPILKLGFFSEIKNTISTENHIGFAFEFDFTKSNRYELTSRLGAMIRDNFRNVLLECQFEVFGNGEIAQLYPVLRRGAITAERIHEELIELDSDGDEHVYAQTSVALSLRIDRPQHSFIANTDLADPARSDGSDMRPVFRVAELDSENRAALLQINVTK